jgi:hypothetical protein
LPSTVLSISDPMLEALGFQFTPAPPFSLDVGAETTASFQITVNSFADCVALGGDVLPVFTGDFLKGPQLTEDTPVDNVMGTSWDLGDAQCTARVVCRMPGCAATADEPACISCADVGVCMSCDKSAPPTMCVPTETAPPPQNASKPVASQTFGFFMSHPDAVTACLAMGSVDLGAFKVQSSVEGMGLLWGSPERFYGGALRGELDRARFLLAREALAGACNHRLFGTHTDSLVAQAAAELRGHDCGRLEALAAELSRFADSGSMRPLPAGFSPGRAAPKAARALAIDPTTAQGGGCR